MHKLSSIFENAIKKLSDLEVISAKFTPKINLVPKAIPEYKGKYDNEHHTNSNTYWKRGMWLTHDAYISTLNSPKTLGDISEVDANMILDHVKKITGKYDPLNNLNKIKPLYEKYFGIIEKTSPGDKKGTAKAIIDGWAELENELDAAMTSREKALDELSKVLDNSVSDKLKRIILTIPEPANIISYIEKALKEKATDKKEVDDKKEEQGPEFDANKKEFDSKDREFIIRTLEKHHDEGVRGIVKRLKKNYNEELLNSLIAAGREFGGVEGMMKYITEYRHRKKLLEYAPMTFPEGKIPVISNATDKIIGVLDKIKKINPPNYSNSVFGFTEKVMELIHSYHQGKELLLDFQLDMLEMLNYLLLIYRRLRIQEVIKSLEKLRETFGDMLKGLDVDAYKQAPDSKDPLEHKLKELLKNKPKITEQDKDIMKMIKERAKEIKDFSPKKTSNEYGSSVFYKLEKLINASSDLMIRGELEDILGILKSNS